MMNWLASTNILKKRKDNDELESGSDNNVDEMSHDAKDNVLDSNYHELTNCLLTL